MVLLSIIIDYVSDVFNNWRKKSEDEFDDPQAEIDRLLEHFKKDPANESSTNEESFEDAESATFDCYKKTGE